MGFTDDHTFFVANSKEVHCLNFENLFADGGAETAESGPGAEGSVFELRPEQVFIAPAGCTRLAGAERTCRGIVVDTSVLEKGVFKVGDGVRLLQLAETRESHEQGFVLGVFETEGNVLDFCKVRAIRVSDEAHPLEVSIAQIVETAQREVALTKNDPILEHTMV